MKLNFSFFLLLLILFSSFAFAENLNLTEVYSTSDVTLGKDYAFKLRLVDSDSGLNVNNAECKVINQITDTVDLITNYETLNTDSQGYLTYKENTNSWKSLAEKSLLDFNGYVEISCYCNSGCILSNGSSFSSYDDDLLVLNYTIAEDETLIEYDLLPFFIGLSLIFVMTVWIYSTLDKKTHFYLKLILLALVGSLMLILFFIINTLLSHTGYSGLNQYSTLITIIMTVLFPSLFMYAAHWLYKNNLED